MSLPSSRRFTFSFVLVLAAGCHDGSTDRDGAAHDDATTGDAGADRGEIDAGGSDARIDDAPMDARPEDGDVDGFVALDAGADALAFDAGPIDGLAEYFKASNTGPGDRFGLSVALSADGSVLAVGAIADNHHAGEPVRR